MSSESKRLILVTLVVTVTCTVGCSKRGGITPIRTSFNRGVHHYSQGRYDQAIHEYRDELRNNPNDQRARFNLALTLEAKARTVDEKRGDKLRREAEQDYREVLRRDPDHLRASINLAILEYELGDTTAAIARLEAASEQHRDAARPHVALAAIHLQETEPDPAELALRDALRIDPASVEANMLLGDALTAQDRLDEAAAAYQQALVTRAADVASMMALAEVEARRGRDRQAVAVLQRLLYVDPDHWRAHLLLSDAARRRGQLERAAYHLWSARRLDHQRPPGTPAPDYPKRLRDLYQELLDRERPVK